MRTRNIVLLIIIVILVLFGILFLSDKIFDSGLIEPVNGPVVEGVGVVCGNDDDCPSDYGCNKGKCYELYCATCGNDCYVTYKGISQSDCSGPTENFKCEVINKECIKRALVCEDGVCGNQRAVLYLPNRVAEIKQGKKFGMAFGIQNFVKEQKFRWEIKVNDPDISRKCGVREQ